MRDILLVGGAPRVRVDAVRYLTVAASGNTAAALYSHLSSRGYSTSLLLSVDAMPQVQALRYHDRPDLERMLQEWIALHPNGIILLSAAINDYEVAQVSTKRATGTAVIAKNEKLPSGAQEVVIRLRPASKVIDQLHSWGHRGPLIGFKYEHKDSVLTAARALRERVNAALVVANSLCGDVQALVGADDVTKCRDRMELLTAMSAQIETLAKSG